MLFVKLGHRHCLNIRRWLIQNDRLCNWSSNPAIKKHINHSPDNPFTIFVIASNANWYSSIDPVYYTFLRAIFILSYRDLPNCTCIASKNSCQLWAISFETTERYHSNAAPSIHNDAIRIRWYSGVQYNKKNSLILNTHTSIFVPSKRGVSILRFFLRMKSFSASLSLASNFYVFSFLTNYLNIASKWSIIFDFLDPTQWADLQMH